MTAVAIEFADPSTGVSVAVSQPGACFVDLGGRRLAAEPTSPGSLDRLEEGRIALAFGEGELSADLSLEGDPVPLAGELIGERRHRPARIAGELREGGERIGFECLGVHSETRAEPGPATRLRSVAIATAEGGLVCIAAALPRGAEEHGRERAEAAMSGPDGPLAFDRALLSTEYDRHGRHRRATVELWPAQPGAQIVRAAGSSVAGTSMEFDGQNLSSALFRWSIDGVPGLGRYQIITSGEA